MAVADITTHCIEMRVPEISKLDWIRSPELSIHGIPWQVEVSKEPGEEEGAYLGVHLYCIRNEATNWSLSGAASFKLLPFCNVEDPVEYHYQGPPMIFDESGFGYGESKFIRWPDLFDETKHYVKNDAIKLEVKVKAEDPNDPKRSRLVFRCVDKCCDNSGLATFRLEVNNIANLMAVRSPTFKLRGLPWAIQVSKEHSSHLGILLKLEEKTGKVTCKMTMSIEVLSSKKDVLPIEICDRKQYQYSKDLNALKVVSWDELMKPENGFVNNDAITLQIELSSGKPESDGGSDMPVAKRARFNIKTETE